MSDWRELRGPDDRPCSCSGDCDRYILALEAERDRLRGALKAEGWGDDDLAELLDLPAEHAELTPSEDGCLCEWRGDLRAGAHADCPIHGTPSEDTADPWGGASSSGGICEDT